MVWDGVLILIGILTAIVIWLRWNYKHWKNMGIPQVEPTIIFGNIKDGLIGGTNMAIVSQRIYNAFPGEPFVGFYQMRKPVLQIKDLDLIKTVLVTEFQNFRENGRDISKEVDPILGRNPFFLKGDEWREARRIQTHQHTASKLRHLFGFVDEVKDELIQYLEKNENRKFQAQDLCSRFTTDIVSSCVFGIKTRSHAEEDCEFRKYSLKLLAMSWKVLVWIAAPSLLNKLKISFVPKVCHDYFYNLVKDVVEHRVKNNLTRADFLQNLLSEKNENFSLIEMTAQMMTFFLDGYATSASEMSFVIYMIAIHPDVQERLRDEIKSAEKMDFETIHKLPYLDAVFNETLRLYPAVVLLTRECNKDTTIIVNKRKLELKVGDQLEIPTYAIHRDPAIFPDPLKFDPNRLLDTPNQPAFLAFGTGPRACLALSYLKHSRVDWRFRNPPALGHRYLSRIAGFHPGQLHYLYMIGSINISWINSECGSRFAKTQIKAGVAGLVKSFRILPGTDDRSLPTVENNTNILLSPDKEMSVRFEKL